jgi:hypothetical protein
MRDALQAWINRNNWQHSVPAIPPVAAAAGAGVQQQQQDVQQQQLASDSGSLSSL